MIVRRDDLRIERSVRHGLTLAWDEVDIARCEVCKTPQGLTQVWALRLWTRDEERVDVALTQANDELASFRDVLALLKSARAAPVPARAMATGTAVVRCARCGAIVAPADLERVACSHCGELVAISPELRARVRAAHELDVRESVRNARIGELLREQPTARTLNRWFGASALVIQLCSPFALLGVGFVPLSKLMQVLRYAVNSRKALRAVGLRFQAHAPARLGDAPSCRACGGPLPATDALVVRCAYCQAENVTAFDGFVPLQFERAAARDLSAEVADYAAMDPRRARRAALVVWLSFAAAALVVLGVAAAYVGVAHHDISF